MNPQEKAIALIQAFIDEGFLPAAARIAALVTIDEMFKYFDREEFKMAYPEIALSEINYLKEVEQEIENL